MSFSVCLLFDLQGSELAGWALGRFSYEGYDMNNNFANLNSVMWDAMELETDKTKLINHYIPIPKQYTSKDAVVSDFLQDIKVNFNRYVFFLIQSINIL